MRTRLLAAFLILLAAALALAVVGGLGMRGTKEALSGFEEDVLPNIARALELAERTAQLSAIAPHLAESRTAETLEANTIVIEGLLGEIRQRSVDLPPGGELRPALNRMLEGVDRDLSALIALTQRRQALDARLRQQVARLEVIGNRMHRLERHSGAVDPAVAGLWSSLVLGATTDAESVLGRLEADVEALLAAAHKRKAFAAFDQPFEAAVTDIAAGPENLLALRRSLGELERRRDYLVAVTRSNADQLGEEVTRHVARLRSAAAQRSDNVALAAHSVETAMLLIAAICLAIAIGATQYVRRHVGQIENITAVMSRLARGDTTAATPATKRRDELGALARAFEVFRDTLLAKQQLVKEQKAQRELLEAVHNSITDGLAVFDAQSRLVLWNPQLALLLDTFAVAPREGITLHELIASFPPATLWAAPGRTEPRALATAQPQDFASLDDVELRLAGGQVFDLRTRAMPGGGAVTLMTDLTARRAIDTQLQHAQKLEVLGQLTGGVAHDFNNYLGTILGTLGLLEERPGIDGPARAQLQRAQRAATRAAALTRRLLAFARRQPLVAERVAVDEMIEEMRDLVEFSAGQHVLCGFTLEAEGAVVHIDRGQLENALLNLVLNAAAAMPTGGDLEVGTRRVREAGKDAVEIRVSDTGTGIPEELLGRVFEPFFSTKSEGGSGLGLSIVYGFAKQSGGHIELASRPGRGTVATLTFSTVPETTAVRPRKGAQPASRPALDDLRVLLVDDDEAFRATVCEMLAAARASVIEAVCGEDALRRMEGGLDVDLILSDVRLGPGMNGLELAEAVARHWPGKRMALMSGLSPEMIAKDLRWDASLPFIQKPFEARALIEWLQALTQGRGRKVVSIVSP